MTKAARGRRRRCQWNRGRFRFRFSASAEYVTPVRRIMDDAGVSFQTAELGKVDVGGGGAIAYIPAKYGLDVIDSDVPVLSMHSPWEVTSKADIYEARRGYEAFLRDAS